MVDLHKGHKSSRGAQLQQQITWPHGTNATSTSASAQIWQRIESRCFTTDSSKLYTWHVHTDLNHDV